ncbi:gamma-glutamyltransferase [Planctomicrobium sp. SH664]|uniref:gamma-glutamyltransferase n=1 Tax=Planctomicrobium sp. SH664 TaxID=3448125 RepID=UPI003F5B128D
MLFKSLRLEMALVCAVWLAPGLTMAQERAVAVTSTGGMVACVSEPAAQAGVEILAMGGNAVDASIAVALALEVTWPEAGNIGGGGFMMVRPVDGRPVVCVEYREQAPAAATSTMFDFNESRLTAKVVGVPGTVRGLALAHKEYGTLPWSKLVAPSVKLARDGFVVDEGLARSMNDVLMLGTTRPLTTFISYYGKPDGSPWKPGDRFVQPELAKTLEILAEQGPEAFYTGPIAEQIVQEMQAGNGLITAKDLASYEPKIRKPVHVNFHGYDIYGAPPPSSGGTCLVLMLQMLDKFDLKSKGRWSPETVHLMTEAMRRAFVNRARYLGDADFVAVPAKLTQRDFAEKVAESISLDKATPSVDLAEEITLTPESPSTTHFSVIDAQGMAVSNTYTLQASWGSRVVVRGAGFLLNNEMTDFNVKPGHTDLKGNIGTPANEIAPGKRMLSSQCPVIVVKDNEVVLATGSPGGRTIINTVFCVVLNSLVFEMPLVDAVAAPRQHHQWLPDELHLEDGDDPKYAELVASLKKMGHKVVNGKRQGDAHSIQRDPATGVLTGVADKRRSGSVMGVDAAKP